MDKSIGTVPYKLLTIYFPGAIESMEMPESAGELRGNRVSFPHKGHLVEVIGDWHFPKLSDIGNKPGLAVHYNKIGDDLKKRAMNCAGMAFDSAEIELRRMRDFYEQGVCSDRIQILHSQSDTAYSFRTRYPFDNPDHFMALTDVRMKYNRIVIKAQIPKTDFQPDRTTIHYRDKRQEAEKSRIIEDRWEGLPRGDFRKIIMMSRWVSPEEDETFTVEGNDLSTSLKRVLEIYANADILNYTEIHAYDPNKHKSGD